jgi:transposase
MEAKVIPITKPLFRSYDQNIEVDFKMRISELVVENSLVQIVDYLVEQIPVEQLEPGYRGGGRPAYHPHMMLKVWIYGYCNKVYTSRPLVRKLKEDIPFIWLGGNQTPCFKTLCAFRAGVLKKILDAVILKMLCYLIEEGYVDLKDLYTDGTKLLANANKHKIIWAKNTARYKEAVLERVRALMLDIENMQAAEDLQNPDTATKVYQSNEEIQKILTSKDIGSLVEQIQQKAQVEADAMNRKKLEKASKEMSLMQNQVMKYESQEEYLGDRNSYSRTDTDATALRLKNELVGPAYNVQITTSNQYVLNATVHDQASDMPTFIPHITELVRRIEKNGLGSMQDLTADAGYGSEENYAFLEGLEVGAYVKYGTWHMEVTGELKKRLYRSENWPYDEDLNRYTCPENRHLPFHHEEEQVTKNGYKKQVKVYICESCAGCPRFSDCRGEKAKPDSNRTVQKSEKLEQYKAQARQRLDSPIGRKHRSQRSVDVETPFGDMKYNCGYQRFILRGKENVAIELWLTLIAHNLRKVYCAKSGIWKEYYAQRATKAA